MLRFKTNLPSGVSPGFYVAQPWLAPKRLIKVRRLGEGRAILRAVLTFCFAACLSACVISTAPAQQPISPPQKINTLEAMQLTAEAFRMAVQRVDPSLVTIESFGGVGAKEGKIGGIRKKGEGNTTGVVISPDGHIITSTFNFVTRPPIVIVVTRDNQRHRARLLGRDELRKICLLKIDDLAEGQSLPVAEIAKLDSIDVGDWALSMGVGYGDLSPAISMGIISAKNRVGGRAIQTDANISPANYGGPLIDIDGRLIGICVPMNPQSQSIGAGVEWYDSGIGFAIPLDGAEELIERLKDPETKIQPAFLGVQTIPNPDGAGLWVKEVVPDSAAAAAGIERGDILTKLAGEDISNILGLRRLLTQFESGHETTIEFIVEETAKTASKKLMFLPPPKPKDEVSQLEPPEIR